MVLHSHTNDKVWLNDCWIVIMDYSSVLLLYYDYCYIMIIMTYIHIYIFIIAKLSIMITYDLWWICMDSSGFWYKTLPWADGPGHQDRAPVLRLAGRPLRQFTSTDTCRDLHCRLVSGCFGAKAAWDGRYVGRYGLGISWDVKWLFLRMKMLKVDGKLKHCWLLDVFSIPSPPSSLLVAVKGVQDSCWL